MNNSKTVKNRFIGRLINIFRYNKKSNKANSSGASPKANILARGKPSNKRTKKTNQGELEAITNNVIEEMKEDLTKDFEQMTKGYRSKPGRLEKEEMYSIIWNLMEKALKERHVLIERIEKDIETGDLYERYYNKMHTINIYTNSAYAMMKKLEVKEESYERQKELYKKVVGEAYEYKLDDKKSTRKKEKKDILVRMDEKKIMLENSEDSGNSEI